MPDSNTFPCDNIGTCITHHCHSKPRVQLRCVHSLGLGKRIVPSIYYSITQNSFAAWKSLYSTSSPLPAPFLPFPQTHGNHWSSMNLSFPECHIVEITLLFRLSHSWDHTTFQIASCHLHLLGYFSLFISWYHIYFLALNSIDGLDVSQITYPFTYWRSSKI